MSQNKKDKFFGYDVIEDTELHINKDTVRFYLTDSKFITVFIKEGKLYVHGLGQLVALPVASNTILIDDKGIVSTKNI